MWPTRMSSEAPGRRVLNCWIASVPIKMINRGRCNSIWARSQGRHCATSTELGRRSPLPAADLPGKHLVTEVTYVRLRKWSSSANPARFTHRSSSLPARPAKGLRGPSSAMPGACPISISRCPGRPWKIGAAEARWPDSTHLVQARMSWCSVRQRLPAPFGELSDGPGGIILPMLAIPLITLQAVVEVAVGGMLALFITDASRLVTRGFIASTGGVLLLVGALGIVGQYLLPDPSHLTEHQVNRAWLQPSLRLTAAFMVAFLLYLIAIFLRPPEWGPYGSAASFLLSAITIGTVTTAMLLGHWYLVVPNLSTRPLFILLGVIAAGLALEAVLAVMALVLLTGHRGFPTSHDVLYASYSLAFWMHIVAGIALPLVITALAFQSTRLRSLMSATGLLYVAVVLTLVGP